MVASHLEFAAWRGQGGLDKQVGLVGRANSCLVFQAVNSVATFSQEYYLSIKKAPSAEAAQFSPI